MGIFKAITKYTARSASDALYNNKDKQIKKEAYKEVGKKIKEAKKNNVKIDGSAAYYNTYTNMAKKNEQKNNRINKFIDDI